MKASILPRISSLIFVAAAFVVGCSSKSGVEDACAKIATCPMPAGDKQTEAQCVSLNKVAITHYSEQPNCQPIADAYDAWFECLANLSCTELQDTSGTGKSPAKCQSKGEEITAAAKANPTCKPLEGGSGDISGSSSSTGDSTTSSTGDSTTSSTGGTGGAGGGM